MKTVIWYCSNCRKKVEIKDGVRQELVDGCQCEPEEYRVKAPAFLGATKYDMTKIPVQLMNPDLDKIRTFTVMEKDGKLTPAQSRYWKKQLGHITSYNYK